MSAFDPGDPMRLLHPRRCAVLGLAAALPLAACGSGDDGDAQAASGVRVAVTASDDACTVATTRLRAGTQRFAVTNEGPETTEFYVFGDGDRVLGEVENIAPGATRELLVRLAAGTYEAACTPSRSEEGVRQQLTVTGEGAGGVQDEALAGAGPTYQEYVRAQSADLLEQTEAFVAAVKAGDVARARALYPVARTPWERIEPVAESFGDLDPLIDGRDGDQEEGQDFTGFHRIEQALWEKNSLAGTAPYADQLLTNVREIVERAGEVTLEPLQLANGAKALLDEIATGKITGEEERYSHTDLYDLAANLEGSKAAIDALRPYLQKAEPDLLTEIDQRFAATVAALAPHRAGRGWVGYQQLSQEQLHGLSDRVTALTESVSRVAAAVADR